MRIVRESIKKNYLILSGYCAIITGATCSIAKKIAMEHVIISYLFSGERLWAIWKGRISMLSVSARHGLEKGEKSLLGWECCPLTRYSTCFTSKLNQQQPNRGNRQPLQLRYLKSNTIKSPFIFPLHVRKSTGASHAFPVSKTHLAAIAAATRRLV